MNVIPFGVSFPKSVISSFEIEIRDFELDTPNEIGSIPNVSLEMSLHKMTFQMSIHNIQMKLAVYTTCHSK